MSALEIDDEDKKLKEEANLDISDNQFGVDVPAETAEEPTEDEVKPANTAVEPEVVIQVGEDIIDANKTKQQSFASKKSVAHRMMDIALLTANANQLRYILMFGQGTAYYYVSLVLIVSSLILQLAVGIFMVFKSNPVNRRDKERTNSIVVSGVLTITIINVLNTAFSIEGSEIHKRTNSTAS